jgi:hypothetical protein
MVFLSRYAMIYLRSVFLFLFPEELGWRKQDQFEKCVLYDIIERGGA